MTEEIGKKLVGESWFNRLRSVIMSSEFDALGSFLASERKKHTVYPSKENVFKAFIETPFDSVKVLILGLDPYNSNLNMATGLAFAHPEGTYLLQPSLAAIETEVERCLGRDTMSYFIEPTLMSWAHQGVLLLNTSLTVRQGQAGSHSEKWAFFTEGVLKALDEGHSGLVVMLWGNHAKSYRRLLNASKQHILESGHPASGCYGADLFSGNNHFKICNELLEKMNGKEAIIKW